MDYGRRRYAGVTLMDGFDLDSYVGRQATIPDTVAFRLDVSAFLGTLPERDRGIALRPGAGHGDDRDRPRIRRLARRDLAVQDTLPKEI